MGQKISNPCGNDRLRYAPGKINRQEFSNGQSGKVICFLQKKKSKQKTNQPLLTLGVGEQVQHGNRRSGFPALRPKGASTSLSVLLLWGAFLRWKSHWSSWRPRVLSSQQGTLPAKHRWHRGSFWGSCPCGQQPRRPRQGRPGCS